MSAGDMSFGYSGEVLTNHQINGEDNFPSSCPTHRDTLFLENARNGFSAELIDFRNLLDSLAGQVEFDQIISIREIDFCGHVYNLHTKGNWYAANGIINDLREYTKKFLDVDLAAVYSGFNEAEEKTYENIMSEEYQLSEGQMCEINEAFGLNEYGEDSGGQDMTWGMYKRDNSSSLGLSIDQRMMTPFNVAVNIEEKLPADYNETDVENALEDWIEFEGFLS